MLGVSLLLPLLALRGTYAKKDAEPSSSSPPPPPDPICDASAFSHPKLDGVKILSISATIQENHEVPPLGMLPGQKDLNFCEVNIHMTHVGTDDDVLVRVWLPTGRDEWNGRLQATGGGGFSTSMSFGMVAGAVKQGYAGVTTDGGHDETSWLSLDWVLNPNRTINWNLWQNYATRSLPEQVLVGKSIVEQYYGEKPHHTYWNGCSGGGRQGYLMAQKYPELLDGIMAAAPALDLVSIAMGAFWPQLVMKERNEYISNCEFSFFRNKVLEACDMIDGFKDGVIIDPDECQFDARDLIGEEFECDGQKQKVTPSMAETVRSIATGPIAPWGKSLWYGIDHGTDHSIIANISISADDIRSQNPMPVSGEFIKTLIFRNPKYDLSSIKESDYWPLWVHALTEFGRSILTDDPDLRALRDAGTKLLSWHGINDGLIPYQATVDYRQRVEREMGGANEVDKFYRLFLAPGVGHCAFGNGPVPSDPLGALVDWVEKDEVPEAIDAETYNEKDELVTRQLCAWPGKPKYMGISDPKRASSWSCVGGTERPELEYEAEFKDRASEILGGIQDRIAGLGMKLSIG